ALVTRQLQQTAQGCELLVERWDLLVHILDVSGAWDDAQHSLALDLLGVPAELRNGATLLEPPDGRDPVEHLKEIAATEVARLKGLREGMLAELDESERESAEKGLYDDRELKRLRRYEAACMGRLRWALGQLAPAPAASPEATGASPPVIETTVAV